MTHQFHSLIEIDIYAFNDLFIQSIYILFLQKTKRKAGQVQTEKVRKSAGDVDIHRGLRQQGGGGGRRLPGAGHHVVLRHL